MKNKVCLVTLVPAHYRCLIYKLLEKELGCSYLFGDMNPTIKRISADALKDTINIESRIIPGTPFYWLKNVLKNTKGKNVIIDDMGIFCLTSWVNILLAKLRRQKIYMWSHGWYGREGFVKKWIKRAYSAMSDGMFLYGEYAKNLMIKNGFNPDKLHVIHNSLDYDTQLNIRKKTQKSDIYKAHFRNNYQVLVFIGRLTNSKRIDMIVEAIAEMKKEGHLFNLVLIGDGEAKSAIEQQIKDLKVEDSVWLYGACYDEGENAELLYNADLCVSPGNVGLTAIHAMMFGTPVITHNDFPYQGPEFEAIKSGVTGDFFSKGDVDSMKMVIIKWFKEHENREAVRMSCYSEIDENWNPHIQVRIISNVING